MLAVRGIEVARRAIRPTAEYVAARALHVSRASSAFSRFTMPAMSPTMTEGGIATWKVDEGKPFSAGDVLLEIETDKATMDVEAQDDGIMAKIIVEAGEKNVPVGKIIAVLAEEGDELNNWESQVDVKDEGQAASSSSSQSGSPSDPKREDKQQQQPSRREKMEDQQPASTSSSSAPDRHSTSPTTSTKSHTDRPAAPMFPSVLRLLRENSLSHNDANAKIKGTGLKGMLTKGDVLAFLGKASSPTGTFKAGKQGIAAQGGPPSKGPPVRDGGEVSAERSEPLTAVQLRAAILGGLALTSRSYLSRTAASNATTNSPLGTPITPGKTDLDEALADYIIAETGPVVGTGKQGGMDKKRDWLEGLI